jgi:hypothetical protein
VYDTLCHATSLCKKKKKKKIGSLAGNSKHDCYKTPLALVTAEREDGQMMNPLEEKGASASWRKRTTTWGFKPRLVIFTSSCGVTLLLELFRYSILTRNQVPKKKTQRKIVSCVAG